MARLLAILATIFLACPQLILGVPVSLHKRALTRVHILRGTAGVTEGCNIDELQALMNEMLPEAETMTENAIRGLARPGVERSSAFVAIFGSGVAPSDISAQHYQPLRPLFAALRNPLLVSDKLSETQDTLILTCSHDKQKEAYATTSNFARGSQNGGKDNRIAFHPRAFMNTLSLQQVEANFKATGQFLIAPLGFTLIHEAQHSRLIVGDKRVGDVVIRVANPAAGADPSQPQVIATRAYGLQQIQYRLTPEQKRSNAQNYAYFALLATIRPELLLDDCGALPQQIGEAKPENEPLRQPLPPSRPGTPSQPAAQCVIPGEGGWFNDIDEDAQQQRTSRRSLNM